MWNAVRALLVESGDNLLLERLIEREAIGLVLRVRVVVFAFFADGPAVLAIEALGPPAVQHAEIRLPVERRLLPACPTGLVRANGVVEPHVGAGDQVPCHIDVVVFQEDHFAPESVAAREAIDLFDQRFARPVGGVRFAREDDLHRAFRVIDDAFEPFHVAENKRGAFIRREPPREADNQRVGVQHALELRHLERAFAEAQVMLAQMAARILDEGVFAFYVCMPQCFVGNLRDRLPERGFIDMVLPIRAQVALK